MFERAGLLVLGTFLAVLPVLAHNGVEHVRGTVSQMTDKIITVKLVDAKADDHAHAAEHQTKATNGKAADHELQILVDQRTKFWNGNRRATIKDLKVGDRVVIDVVEKDEGSVAESVKFASIKTATK